MKTITRLGLVGAIIAAALAFFGAEMPAVAQVTRYFAPRVLQTQTTVHYRKTVNFNDASIGSGVKFGALPNNAYITGIRCYVLTAFNAGTTNNLTIGTTATGSDLLAGGTTTGTNCVAGTTGNQNMTSAPGLGLAVTGVGTTPTGATGGWDLYVRYTQTGTAATAGQVVFLIDYIANDDQ